MVLGCNDENNTIVKQNKVLQDMLMMVYANGKERSEREWERLFLDAGFGSYKITHTLGLISIIQVFP
ncbi:trans-resveratrol di-O-methyltransferase-like [Dorcoceras hygrometricum]|uniref:Trans-resveratrol di-O-methyltransferase-like n=1 Tax=Dorcoceras hygrometricum TaxID=472368 RepID=A0A2Z7BX66_9LAMI|nr:trans-resveratrol di-O-methyltransferase-like [Dorcoceras hygrometricum]